MPDALGIVFIVLLAQTSSIILQKQVEAYTQPRIATSPNLLSVVPHTEPVLKVSRLDLPWRVVYKLKLHTISLPCFRV